MPRDRFLCFAGKYVFEVHSKSNFEVGIKEVDDHVHAWHKMPVDAV